MPGDDLLADPVDPVPDGVLVVAESVRGHLPAGFPQGGREVASEIELDLVEERDQFRVGALGGCRPASSGPADLGFWWSLLGAGQEPQVAAVAAGEERVARVGEPVRDQPDAHGD